MIERRGFYPAAFFVRLGRENYLLNSSRAACNIAAAAILSMISDRRARLILAAIRCSWVSAVVKLSSISATGRRVAAAMAWAQSRAAWARGPSFLLIVQGQTDDEATDTLPRRDGGDLRGVLFEFGPDERAIGAGDLPADIRQRDADPLGARVQPQEARTGGKLGGEVCEVEELHAGGYGPADN